MGEEENNVEPVSTEASTPTNQRKGFNITSLILGIVSLITFCAWYISIPAVIIAIVLSIIARKDEGRGMGVAGMVMGIIGLIIAILWLVVLGGMILALNEAGYAY